MISYLDYNEWMMIHEVKAHQRHHLHEMYAHENRRSCSKSVQLTKLINRTTKILSHIWDKNFATFNLRTFLVSSL